jgi:hypothetical protein
MFKETDNNYQIKIGNEIYNIEIAESNVFDTKFKVGCDGKYLATLAMDEEGNWQTKAGELQGELIEKIGRAIEEYDMR